MRQIQRRTRRFVRRQANWFKADDPRIRWYHAGEGALKALWPDVAEFLQRAG